MLRIAVRLSVLHGVWSRVLRVSTDNPEKPMEYVSLAVHNQFSLIITQGIIDLEVELLASLQRRIFSSKGPGKENMLPIWTSLWLLILTYRNIVDA